MKRIGIVGAGVSGLVAGFLLHRRHDLTIFDASDWLGGHIHTVPISIAGRRWPVDTGFIVYNERTYPQFCRLLDALEVPSNPTEMSFSVRCETTGLEYSGASLDGLFAQRSNLLRPSFWMMLRDILRFWRDARALLARPDPKMTLGSFLDGRDYSRQFIEQHLLPMGASIWSLDARQMRHFPAVAFAGFLENHGLLQLRDRPVWRVIRGGSARYVERLVAPFRERIHLQTPVRRIHRRPDGVEIVVGTGEQYWFDEVVIATHSDEALALLADPSPAERDVLGAIRYQRNDVALHTDDGLLPHRRRAWASWNYHLPRNPRDGVALTYAMNRLQGLDAPEQICVTLNRSRDIDPSRIFGRFVYAHPLFDLAALEAQTQWSALSGHNRTHYCGAYWGHGFHEDGVRSALAVAASFGLGLS